jgi:hypothetical protein
MHSSCGERPMFRIPDIRFQRNERFLLSNAPTRAVPLPVTRPPAATNSNAKSETQNPKSETSSKSETRMSKTHARTHAATLLRVLDRSIVF